MANAVLCNLGKVRIFRKASKQTKKHRALNRDKQCSTGDHREVAPVVLKQSGRTEVRNNTELFRGITVDLPSLHRMATG